MKKLVIKIGKNFNKENKLDAQQLFNGNNKGIQQNVLYLDSFQELFDLLSPKKIDLLNFLMKSNNNSVTTIAHNLNRKQEAISRDIKQLKKLCLIETKKEKQKTIVNPKHFSIEITT